MALRGGGRGGKNEDGRDASAGPHPLVAAGDLERAGPDGFPSLPGPNGAGERDGRRAVLANETVGCDEGLLAGRKKSVPRPPAPGLKTQRTPSEAARSPAAGPAARSGASIRIPAESATAGPPSRPYACRIPVAAVKAAESPATAVVPPLASVPISAVTPPAAAQSPAVPSGPTEKRAFPARTMIDNPAADRRSKATEPSASADETEGTAEGRRRSCRRRWTFPPELPGLHRSGRRGPVPRKGRTRGRSRLRPP
ncbi:MAG: hypothetical protein MZW92_61265 [Comamonadaceae bacterium]|nr:hypothetical protein [Comamonadaceae bacterium]